MTLLAFAQGMTAEPSVTAILLRVAFFVVLAGFLYLIRHGYRVWRTRAVARHRLNSMAEGEEP